MKSKRKAAINCTKKLRNSYKETSEWSSNGVVNSDNEDIFAAQESVDSSELSSSDNCGESDNEIANEPDKINNVVDNNYRHRSEEPVANSPKNCFIGTAALLLRAQNYGIDNGLGLLKMNFQKNFNYFNKLSQSAYWADKILLDGTDEFDVFIHLNEGLFPNKRFLDEIKKVDKKKELLNSLSSINVLQSETDLQHELMKPFSSISVTNPVVNQHGVFINTGSYVKRMCWAPINSELYTDQFLAVSVYKELTDRSIIFESSNQSGHLIQIFNCGPLTMRTKKAAPSKLEMVLTHSWGKVTDMSWSPQPLPAVCRSGKLIGHLALCCSDGFIRIIPISKQSNPGCLVTINNNHPILCLGSVRNKDNVNVYPTTMHWRQEYPDRIVAGYNTGNIAVFVLEASVLMRSRIIGVDVYLKPSMFRRVFNGPVRSIQISPFNWRLISCSSLTAANAVIVDLSQPPDMILPSPVDLETTIGSKIIWPIPGDVVVLAAGKHLHNKPGIQLCSAQKPAKRCRKLTLNDISSIDLSQSLNVVPIGTRSGQLRLLSMNTDYVNNLLKNRACERKSREKQIESTFYFQYRLTQMNTHDDNDDDNNNKEIDSLVKTEKNTVLPFCGCPVNLQCVHKLISKFSISISKNCSDELNDWQLGSMLNINEISTNPNPGSSTWISVALECGLIHVVPLTHFYRSELDEMSNGSSCCVLNAAACRLIDEILLPKSISYLPKYGRPRKYPSGTNHGKVYRRMEKTYKNKNNSTKQENNSIEEVATSSKISEFLPPNISTISLPRKSTCITDYFKRNCSVELEKPTVQIPLTNVSEKSKSQRKSSVKSCKTEIKPNNVKCSTPKKSKPIKPLQIIQASTPIKKPDNSSNTSMKTRLRTYQQSTLFSPVLVKKSINSQKNTVTIKTSLPLVLPSKNQSCSIENNKKKLVNSFIEKNSIKTESPFEDISLPIRRRLRSHDKELNSSTGNQMNSMNPIDMTNNTVPQSISTTKNTLPTVLSPKNQSCSIENSNMKLASSSSEKESVKLNTSLENTPFEDISLSNRRRLRSHDKELNSSIGNRINSSKSIDLTNNTVAPSISVTKTTLPIVLSSKNQSRSIENSNMKLARSSSEKETVKLASFENISLPIRRRLRSYDKELCSSIGNRINSSKSVDLTNNTVPPSISITKTTLPIVLLQKNKSRSIEDINMKLARSSIDKESVTSKSPSFENTSFEEIPIPIRTRLRSYETESNSLNTLSQINSLNKSNKIISMDINNFDVSHDNTANSIRNQLRSLSKETNTFTDNEKEIRKRPMSYDKRKEEKVLFKEVLTRKRSPSFESSEFNLSLDHQEVEPTWKRLRSWDKHDISPSCVTPMKKETNITKKCDKEKKFPVKKKCKYFETNESVRVESIINQSSSLSINESIFSNDEKLSMSPVIIVEHLSQTEIKSFDKTDAKLGKSNEVKVSNCEPTGKLLKENVTNKSKQVRKKSEKFNEKSPSENQIINVVGKESKSSIKLKKSEISSKKVEKIENLEKETAVKEKRKSRKVDESSVKGENIKSIKRKRKLSNNVQESKKPKLDEISSSVSNAQFNTNNNAVTSITNSPPNEKSSIKKIDIQKSNIQTVPLRRFFNTDIDEEEDYIETSRMLGSVYNTISCQDVTESQIDISRSETILKIHNNSVPSNLDELQPISHSTPASRNIETKEEEEKEEEEEEEDKSPVKKKSKKSKKIFKESKSQKKETKKSKNNLINEEKLKKLQNIFSNKRKELLDSQSITKETVVQCPPPPVSIELQPASNSKTSCWWGQENQQNKDQVELDVNKIDDLSLKSNFVSPRKKTNINASMDDRMDKIKQVISRGISQCDLDENVVDNYSPELLQPFRPLKTPKSLNSSLSFNS